MHLGSRYLSRYLVKVNKKSLFSFLNSSIFSFRIYYRRRVHLKPKFFISIFHFLFIFFFLLFISQIYIHKYRYFFPTSRYSNISLQRASTVKLPKKSPMVFRAAKSKLLKFSHSCTQNNLEEKNEQRISEHSRKQARNAYLCS